MRKNTKSLFKTLLAYLPAIIIPGLLKWATIPVFTNLLSTSEYADYALFIVTLGMLSSLNSWVGMAAMRFFPEEEKSGRPYRFILGMLLFSLLFALGISIAVFIGMLLFQESLGFGISAILLFVVLFFLTEYSSLLLNLNRIKQQILVFGLFTSWKAIALLFLGGGVAYLFEPSLFSILLGFTAGMIVGVPVLHMVTLSGSDKAKSSWLSLQEIYLNSRFFRTIARYGVPLMFAEFAVWGLRFSDRWIMRLLVGKEDLSIYDASYGLIEATVLVLVSLFQLAIRPYEIAKWNESREEEIGGQITDVVSLYLLVVLPLSVLFVGVADILINTLLPDGYAAGVVIVPWVVFAMFFLGLQQRIQSVLVYNKDTKDVAYGAALAFAINLVLNLVFIPRYSLIAAAINTLIGYLVFCLYIFYGSRKVMDWKFPYMLLGKLCIVSFAILPLVFLIKEQLLSVINIPLLVLVITGLLGLVFYVSCIILMKERRLFLSFIRG